jgi:hypothetical protein
MIDEDDRKLKVDTPYCRRWQSLSRHNFSAMQPNSAEGTQKQPSAELSIWPAEPLAKLCPFLFVTFSFGHAKEKVRAYEQKIRQHKYSSSHASISQTSK